VSDHRVPLKITAPLDLKSVTRDSDLVVTDIKIYTGDYSKGSGFQDWISCGSVDLRAPTGPSPWMLNARAKEGITDFEHDSAYIFRIPVVGVELSFISNGYTYLKGYIGGDVDDLRVPMETGYDPLKLKGTKTCKSCKKPHPIVEEGFWAGPKCTHKDWLALVSRRIEICFGPAPVRRVSGTRRDEDDDE
jgi:hypothetical protein